MALPTETLRISMMAHGDPTYAVRLHELLRQQEAAGMIRIVHMDDEIAVTQVLDPKMQRFFYGRTFDGGLQ